MSELSPVSARERVVVLDVLRAFALCGVLIGNLYWLYCGRFLRGPWFPYVEDAGALDTVARWFVHVFVESKAQTLLTFMFGFGFAAQLLRAEARGEPVMGVYLRRLFVLLAIGALHVTILWWGDVTWTYAVAGFGLLLFQRASNRARVAWAIVLMFVPLLVLQLPGVRAAAADLVLEQKQLVVYFKQLADAMRSPDYTGAAHAHVVFALAWQVGIYAWYYFWLIGRFLLGYVVGKLRWFDEEGAQHLPAFRRLLAAGLVAGAAGTAMGIVDQLGLLEGYELTPLGHMGHAALRELGLLGLASAYVAAVVLLMQRPGWRRVLRVLAPAGRMPLTTYVSQSVICTFVFYGWGLGWAGQVRSAGCVGLALGFFALQVAACHLWLRYFRFGPLEWVWRTLVYLRRQPMRV
jgi:uncharacterized protein